MSPKRITLALPNVRSGERPPTVCPCYGATGLVSYFDLWVWYACDAMYEQTKDSVWTAQRACRNPSTDAVLAALEGK